MNNFRSDENRAHNKTEKQVAMVSTLGMQDDLVQVGVPFFKYMVPDNCQAINVMLAIGQTPNAKMEIVVEIDNRLNRTSRKEKWEVSPGLNEMTPFDLKKGEQITLTFVSPEDIEGSVEDVWLSGKLVFN